VGDAAILCPLDDPGQWVERITDLMRDPEQQKRLSEKARIQARSFTWESVAGKILNTIETG
jgi:glycosyltransferase involved in cell wall biosynthesis